VPADAGEAEGAEEALALAGVGAGWAAGAAGAGWLALVAAAELDELALVDFGFDAAAGWAGALAAAAVLPPTVTSGVIFLMVAAEMPALDKPSTDEYGRPAIIFLAVAAPTPGKASRSFSVAVFTSTLAAVEAAFVAGEEELDDLLLDWAARAVEAAPPIKSATEKQSAIRARIAFIGFSFVLRGMMIYSDFPKRPLSPATTALALSPSPPAWPVSLLRNASRWLVTASGRRPFKWVTTASTNSCALSCGSPVFCITS
jgi:hypothetical protein